MTPLYDGHWARMLSCQLHICYCVWNVLFILEKRVYNTVCFQGLAHRLFLAIWINVFINHTYSLFVFVTDIFVG